MSNVYFGVLLFFVCGYYDTMIMVHACATIIVQACTMITVHACTMTIVCTCTMIIAHACTMIIEHACTMAIVPCPTRLMFPQVEGGRSGGRSPRGKPGGLGCRQAPQWYFFLCVRTSTDPLRDSGMLDNTPWLRPIQMAMQCQSRR